MSFDFKMLLDFVIEYHWTLVFTLAKGKADL